MHFSGLLAVLVATAAALPRPTGEVKTQTQDPQVAGYGIYHGQWHGYFSYLPPSGKADEAKLEEKRVRKKRGVTLPDVWYGKYNPYDKYATYDSYPPGAEGKASEMKREATTKEV